MRFEEIATYVRTPRDFDYESVSTFLTATRVGDVPIYVAAGDWFIYGIVVPEHLVDRGAVGDIMEWNFGIPRGYGFGYSLTGDCDPELSEPLDLLHSKVLEQGRPTLFLRSWEGRSSYVEPEQRLLHTLGLHHVPDMDAWCELNDLGEIVPTLHVAHDDGWVCTLDRDALDQYLVLTKSCLVRVVDVTKRGVAPAPTHGDADLVDKEREIYLRPWFTDNLVVLRGFDVLRVGGDRRGHVVLRLQGKEPREYASFIVHDFKHDRVTEASSDPEKIGNYFVPSDLPFGTSPVHFKPDVLLQFRTDPERFNVLLDRVVCKGAWALPYYVNDAGQVHAYLIDLSRLPYPAQLQWKAFNEAPKGGISKRAWKQDFMADWDLEYDALRSLLEVLCAFPSSDSEGRPMDLWALGDLPETRGLDFLGYVVTNARKELEDQLTALHQIVVEGLKRGTVNLLADKLGCRNKDLGSLKQLGLVMETLGIDEDVRNEILGPLLEMQGHRSSKIAHRGTGLIAKDPKAYWRDLLARSDRAMRALADLVERGRFFVEA